MYVFLIWLFQIHFAIGENIDTFRQRGEYVLYQKRHGGILINSPYKLISLQKNVNVNIIQETIGSRWPLGVVSYYFDSQSYDNIIADRLRSVMNMLESASCLKFNSLFKKPDNITWIHVTNPNRDRECVHEIKNNNDGEVTLVLGYDCLMENELLHALLHAIGLNDEVTHPHRDRYIRVLWNNIHPEHRKLYRIRPQDASKTLAEYDPLSIMQFHDRAFSSNGQATIVPLISGLIINPSEELSQLDKMKLHLLFEHECNKRKVGDLLDSCKNAFHTKLKDSSGASSQSQEGDLDNDSEAGELSDEKRGNNDELKESFEENNDGPIDDNRSDKDYSNNNFGNELNELKTQSETQEHSAVKDESKGHDDNVDHDKFEDGSKNTSLN